MKEGADVALARLAWRATVGREGLGCTLGSRSKIPPMN